MYSLNTLHRQTSRAAFFMQLPFAGQENKKMVALYTAAEAKESRDELTARMQSIIDSAKSAERPLSDDEKSQIDDIRKNQIPALDDDIERLTDIESRTMQKLADRVNNGVIRFPSDGTGESVDDPIARVRVPANVVRNSNRVGFNGKDGDRDGYISGLWVASLLGHEWAKNRLESLGIQNAMEGGTTSAGGAVVPTPLANEIIRLVEEYGVFRRYSRVVPMTSATLTVPRRTAGLTVQYPDEGASITPSDLTMAQATLTARKYATLTLMSTELNEDAVISMAALMAQEIAYAVAVAEDTNGFTGDGTGTFASITGVENALAAGSIKAAATGRDTVAELTLADYHAAQGAQLKVPGRRNYWFVNSDVYYNSMAPLMTAAGGNTATDIANGTQPRFLGSPVVFTEVLPNSAAAAESTVAYFGDLSLASTMGSRRDVTIKTLMELYAATDQIGIQATTRSAITVHEVGTSTVGGPLIGVQLAAS